MFEELSRDFCYRTLVVDDEADVRDYLRTALEDAGFEVETAADGLEALEAVRRRAPDLISLDLVMPRHSGAKFHRELRKDKRLAHIPVLVVTGHARDELGRADFEEMTLSGPGVYLEKPVRPATYVAAVRRLLGMEAPEPPEAEAENLREELAQALSGADRIALERALEALRKGIPPTGPKEQK
jgi:CheY-like chemotaxis protein